VVGCLALFVARRCATAGRHLHAVVAVALAGLLVSPVSWSHHWVWVVLLPVAVLGSNGSALTTPVRVGLGGLLVLAVAGPYWWLSHGALADVLMDVLPLWAVGTLALWAGAERRPAAGTRRVVGVLSPG
jgi:alpha-1,2-mannosyltransferase